MVTVLETSLRLKETRITHNLQKPPRPILPISQPSEKLCRSLNFPHQDHLQERRPWTRWITGAASLEPFLNGTRHSVLFYLILSSGTPRKQTLDFQM